MPKYRIIAPIKIPGRGIVRAGDIDLDADAGALLVRQGFLAAPAAPPPQAGATEPSGAGRNAAKGKAAR
jgi:hypothetical protein